MPFRKEKILPAEQTPVETQRTPEYSGETLNMIESIDNCLAGSENLLSGLGRLAKEQIITDPKELEEIYAPKEIGRVDLEAKYGDAEVFEIAGKGLQVRNTLKRVITLGLAGSKYGIKSEESLFDTRKLKEGVEGQKQDLYYNELLETAREFGLNPSDINDRDFFKTYAEGKKGIEKQVGDWLILLDLRNAVGSAKTTVENNFKINNIFNLNSSMTLGQARQNYIQYLIDFQKIPAVRARRQANDKFEEIIKKLSV